MNDTYHAVEGTTACVSRRNAELADTLTPEEQIELTKIEAEWAAVQKRPEPAFGAALPQVLRRPQRFQNYDPWPEVPFIEERRPMTLFSIVLYGLLWGLAIGVVVLANWRN